MFSIIDIWDVTASLSASVFELLTHENRAPVCERQANADFPLIWSFSRGAENQG